MTRSGSIARGMGFDQLQKGLAITETDNFFSNLWDNYVAMTPQAQRIRDAFEQRGERVVNDHVAFRTLALEPIGLQRLESHLLHLGYERFEPYEFPAKKLRAFGYTPPSDQLPRLFLSELLVDQLSDRASQILNRCVSQVEPVRLHSADILWAGRLWDPITFDEYQHLLQESEYAAWVATLGLRPNHFTLSVNHLQQYSEVEDVLQVVESLGCQINDSGGRVKGTAEVLLEQGSTMADRLQVDFADNQRHEVPTCYYEFAKRYRTDRGDLFQGFVAQSADRIFESTDASDKTSRPTESS